jgi:hypothetical protein
MDQEQLQHDFQNNLKALVFGANRRAYQAHTRHDDQVVAPAFRRIAVQMQAGLHLHHRGNKIFAAAGIFHTAANGNIHMVHEPIPATVILHRLPPGESAALLHGYEHEGSFGALRQANLQLGAQLPLPLPAAADDFGYQDLGGLGLRFAAVPVFFLFLARPRGARRAGKLGLAEAILVVFLFFARPRSARRAGRLMVRLLMRSARRTITILESHDLTSKVFAFGQSIVFSVKGVSLHPMHAL